DRLPPVCLPIECFHLDREQAAVLLPLPHLEVDLTRPEGAPERGPNMNDHAERDGDLNHEERDKSEEERGENEKAESKTVPSVLLCLVSDQRGGRAAENAGDEVKCKQG